MKRLHLLLLATVTILLKSNCFAGDIYINFDTDAYGNPLTAPDFFFQTSPLTELYAPIGVHFSGSRAGYGGAILNQGGSFGVPALSGENFLAFNAMGDLSYAVAPETITFDTPMTSVSIFAAGGGGEYGPFTMQAFDVGGLPLDTDTVDSPPNGYGELSVSSPEGIHSVVLTIDVGFTSWVYDNLSATPVPEPNSLSFIVSGLIAFLLMCRLTPCWSQCRLRRSVCAAGFGLAGVTGGVAQL
jgi:hypothetical protein